MDFNNFSALMIDNNRSKCYIQNLIFNGFTPKSVVILGSESGRKYQNSISLHKITGFNSTFNSNESIYSTLKKNDIPIIEINSPDVNCSTIKDFVKKSEVSFILYSGPSGNIVRKDILDLGVPFVHAHPGELPDYRGSTTIYYSMLLDDFIGCSIITLSPQIDCGDILFSKKYNVPIEIIDYDMVFDPIVRTDTLLEFFKKNNGYNMPIRQSFNGNTFYIIHPVMKHMSILKAKQIMKRNTPS